MLFVQTRDVRYNYTILNEYAVKMSYMKDWKINKLFYYLKRFCEKNKLRFVVEC